jgi:hypothetical protein
VHMLMRIPPKCGVAGGGVFERQECNPHCAGVWRQAPELCRGAFLGAWILGVHGWAG